MRLGYRARQVLVLGLPPLHLAEQQSSLTVQLWPTSTQDGVGDGGGGGGGLGWGGDGGLGEGSGGDGGLGGSAVLPSQSLSAPSTRPSQSLSTPSAQLVSLAPQDTASTVT